MVTEVAIKAFLNSRISKGLSPNTIRWYRGILLTFAKQHKKLPKKPEDIERFLAGCRAGDERRHGYYRSLRCFYGFLQKRFKVANPIKSIDPPRRTRKQPKFLVPSDLNHLLNYTMQPRVKTAIISLVDTGARLSEIGTLTINELVQTPWGFTARIQGKTGMRIVPISYDTYHALMVHLPFRVKPHRLGRLISLTMKSAGVKGNAQALRHTFATLWQGDELVLQQIMGHSNLATTKLYRHLRTQMLSAQHSQFSPLKMVLSTSKSML